MVNRTERSFNIEYVQDALLDMSGIPYDSEVTPKEVTLGDGTTVVIAISQIDYDGVHMEVNVDGDVFRAYFKVYEEA
jgi:hypothetical protein